jgi:hypothetical protein
MKMPLIGFEHLIHKSTFLGEKYFQVPKVSCPARDQQTKTTSANPAPDKTSNPGIRALPHKPVVCRIFPYLVSILTAVQKIQIQICTLSMHETSGRDI